MIQVKAKSFSFAFYTNIYQITVDTNRSRLLTVTIDGRLDIWDFDATKHIIYKDQSAPNRPLILNNTTSFDSAFNLVGNKETSGICMTLTSKNIMVNNNITCLLLHIFK